MLVTMEVNETVQAGTRTGPHYKYLMETTIPGGKDVDQGLVNGSAFDCSHNDRLRPHQSGVNIKL